MFEAAWYVWAIVLVAVGTLGVATGMVLYRGGVAGQLDPRLARRRGIATVLALLGAAALSGWLAAAGFYSGEAGGSVPWIPLVFIAMLTGLLFSTRLPAVAKALDSSGSVVRLTLPHTVRVFGGVFLIVMAQDWLPAIFALPAGLGDIAVGIAAPFVAMRLARGKGVRRAVWFNVLGLLDLLVALTIGFLAATGPFQVLDVQPSTDVLALLPLALIPTVAVPVAIALHIVALRRLSRDTQQADKLDQGLEVGLS